MAPGRAIFISYRREDAAGYAGRISDRLRAHFPDRDVFLDTESIGVGEDFAAQIQNRLASTGVLVAVIGRGWASAADQAGCHRLDDPADPVRCEISTAFDLNVPILPVLVGGARIPREREVPGLLHQLLKLNVLEINDMDFNRSMDILVNACERLLTGRSGGLIIRKVCMVGAYGVGKTSLVRRFVESIFDDSYLTTIGVKIDKKEVRIGQRRVQLALWDIAGESETTPIRMTHLRGASGYFLVADGCVRETLRRAMELDELIQSRLGVMHRILVVNKADLITEWQVDLGHLQTLNLTVFTTSAKTGQGVEMMFTAMARKLAPET